MTKHRILPAAALLLIAGSALADCPTLNLSKDWINWVHRDQIVGLNNPLPGQYKIPSPGMGTTLRYTIDISVSGTGTAYDVVVIDTLPAQFGEILWNEPMPAGWSRTLTATLAGGEEVWRFSRADPMPEGPVIETIVVDFKISNCYPGGPFPANSVVAVFTTTCSGSDRYSAIATTQWLPIPCASLMLPRIYSSNGEMVRSFEPLPLGIPVHELLFAFYPSSVPGSPLSPDGDGVNDLVRFVFPELTMADGKPYDRIAWDGRDDAGAFVPNGTYEIVVATVDCSTGQVITIGKILAVITSVGVAAEALGPGQAKVLGGADGHLSPAAGEQARIMARPTGVGVLTVKILNLRGQLVRRLQRGVSGGTTVTIFWDGRTSSGALAPPGVYPVLITGPGVTAKAKLGILR